MINDSLTIMERDLESCMANFGEFVSDLGPLNKNPEQKKKLRKIEKSLLDASMHVSAINKGESSGRKLKGGKNLKLEAKRLKGLQVELERTNKLNTLLMKEVKKMKKT